MNSFSHTTLKLFTRDDQEMFRHNYGYSKVFHNYKNKVYILFNNMSTLKTLQFVPRMPWTFIIDSSFVLFVTLTSKIHQRNKTKTNKQIS